jgi:hypothetical protein
MKKLLSVALGLAAFMAVAQAQKHTVTTKSPAPPPPAPPVYPAPTPAAAVGPVYLYDQKPVGGRSYLIAPEQAQGIIDRFKEQYPKLGSPRVVVYVNRDLVDENSGMKLSSHKQVIETTRPADAGGNARPVERMVSTNIYRVGDGKETPLADKQTVRDVERLFGRPLRMAGVQLADQRVAAQLIGARSLDHVSADGEQARRDREALAKIADVVLEILVSSKDVTLPGVSGDRIYSAPDIQATAIRLSDARILAQATASDLIGQGAAAGMAARNYGVREIAEATALSLMEDMMLH